MTDLPPTHDDHDDDYDLNHDHESETAGEGGNEKRRRLEAITCRWRGKILSLDEAGIRVLLRSPKCTITNIAWATRHLMLRSAEAEEKREEKFRPMGYVFRLIKHGCDEPPTDQELAHKLPDRPRIPDTPPPIPPAELTRLRDTAAKLPPADRLAFWKQSTAAPIAAPLAGAIERTLAEIPRLSDEQQSRLIADLDEAGREELLAQALKRWPRDVIESWRRQDIRPLDVPAVREAVAIAATRRAEEPAAR